MTTSCSKGSQWTTGMGRRGVPWFQILIKVGLESLDCSEERVEVGGGGGVGEFVGRK